MKHYFNVPTSKISWLSISRLAGGVIGDLYYPESIDELIYIVNQCRQEGRKFYIFGHTSNSYFLPSFSPPVVICINNLRGYNETENTITTECGMHTKVLAKMMVDTGFRGFEGLIDLPGTISGAVYGNAGCYGSLISDNLISAKILTPNGDIVCYDKDKLGFKHRSSFLKEGNIDGVILTVDFKKIKGDIEELKLKAKQYHKDRIITQPGPMNNLGSIFKYNELSTFGNWVRRIGRIVSKLLCISEESRLILKLKLFISGYPSLSKYLFNLNRFMWVDYKAYSAFNKYLKLREKLYKNNDFEIEIFK